MSPARLRATIIAPSEFLIFSKSCCSIASTVRKVRHVYTKLKFKFAVIYQPLDTLACAKMRTNTINTICAYSMLPSVISSCT